MNNLANSLWNKRLPSLLGFFVFAISLGTIAWMSTNAILFGTKAAIDETPKNVQISNVTDTSFTISYTTDDAVLGSLSYDTPGQVKQVILDNRDKNQSTPKESTVHFITATNLTPHTPYTVSIISGAKTFLDNGRPYSVITGPSLKTDSKEENMLSGKIMLDTGGPAEAIVTISTNGSQTLSTLSKPDGTYQIDLSPLRDQSLLGFIPLSPKTPLKLQATNATAKSTVSLLKSQINPVPLIILSSNYDFTISTQPLSPSPSASGSATPSASPPAFPTTEESTNAAPQILTPKEDQTFKDQQPLFKGKAVPNETVTITINSEQTITATVKADDRGNWQYRPEEPLEPGTHTITIRTTDASGLIRVITESFIVHAEGGQFVEASISPSTTM